MKNDNKSYNEYIVEISPMGIMRGGMKFNAKIATTIINLYLALSVVFFLIHLVAPLLGGKLLYSAIVKYGSWIGMAFSLRFILNKVQRKVRINIVELALLTIYFGCCMILWLPPPLNILFFLLVIIGNIGGYIAQKKWQRES
jgi:hypothetical protein